MDQRSLSWGLGAAAAAGILTATALPSVACGGPGKAPNPAHGPFDGDVSAGPSETHSKAFYPPEMSLSCVEQPNYKAGAIVGLVAGLVAAVVTHRRY